MDFNQLKKDLDNDVRNHFYVFTGEEKEVMKKYIKRIDPNYQSADKLQKVIIRMQNKGLFNMTASTYVIYNDETSPILEDLKRLLNLIGKDTVILIYDKIDERKKFFKALKPYTVQFKKFTEQQLVGHIQKYVDVSDKLAMVISRYCNNEVARIELECHKLLHLGKPITLEVVNEIITPPAEDRIFEMVDCVVREKKSDAWELYADLKQLGESPIKMVSILYTKLKQVFLVQSMFSSSNTDIAAKTGLTFYHVSQSRDLCGARTLESILDAIQRTQKLEVAMKTGTVGIDVGMDNLLISMMK